MKIVLNNNVVRRVISNDSDCSRCVFRNNNPSCIPELVDFCTTNNNYILHLGELANSIFLI